MQFVVVDLQETVLNSVLAAKSALSRICGVVWGYPGGCDVCTRGPSLICSHTSHPKTRGRGSLSIGRPSATDRQWRQPSHARAFPDYYTRCGTVNMLVIQDSLGPWNSYKKYLGNVSPMYKQFGVWVLQVHLACKFSCHHILACLAISIVRWYQPLS